MSLVPRLDLDLSQNAISDVLLSLPDAQAESALGWLESIVTVLQSAVGSTDFYEKATQAMVHLIGLDGGWALLRKGNAWREATRFPPPQDDRTARVSSQILASMLREKRTVWGHPGGSSWETQVSLVGVQAVVAAPIIDRSGEVIGALYGDRRIQKKAQAPHRIQPRPITKVEAMLVRALASSVAAGLARVEQERAARVQAQAASAARALFGQFFTPELADKMAADPDMLKGRQTEVTLLFCDIRKFSGINERLEPAETVEWLNDVIGALSDCVLDHDGVLVDYIGDELMAMWGAPSEQPDQALLACSAAVAMHDCLQELNVRWQDRLGEPFRIGIGINSGSALVGNTGSRRKLKYGPLGTTVNVASRVQGLTKHLGPDILLTAATQARLSGDFATRRISKVKLVNLTQPVDVYELQPDPDDAWHGLRQGYEEALAQFEKRAMGKAAEALGSLVSQYPEDRPSLLLFRRAGELMMSSEALDPLWDPSFIPPSK
jgi:adenylate cyclase